MSSTMTLTINRLDEVSSTQESAKQLAEAGAVEGTVVVARTQERGRGRLGRRWLSPPGGLWFSIVLRPTCPPARVAGLTLLAAVSVANAVRSVTKIEAGIKWPNDILIGGRKVGGILTEMTAEMNVVKYVVLGVGLNVNIDTSGFPHDLLMPATSLKEEAGRQVDLEKLLKTCLKNLTADYKKLGDGFVEILERWKALSVVIGKKVKVSQPGTAIEGKAVAVHADGALEVVDGEGSSHIVHAGDLSILR